MTAKSDIFIYSTQASFGQGEFASQPGLQQNHHIKESVWDYWPEQSIIQVDFIPVSHPKWRFERRIRARCWMAFRRKSKCHERGQIFMNPVYL